MSRFFEVIESKHQIQNPTSADKIGLLGERLGLHAGSQVLDMGAGRGGPAVLLASSFGCHVTCVERSEAFLSAAKESAARAGVEELVELIHGDAKEFAIQAQGYDSAICLGASFIWGNLEKTVGALAGGVRRGGFVAVGEPYWRRWPLPEGFGPEEGYDFVTLAETAARFEIPGIELVTLIASSESEWDAYESLRWYALEEWLHQNPEDEDAQSFREMGRGDRHLYLRWHRDLLGWAIFVGRKR